MCTILNVENNVRTTHRELRTRAFEERGRMKGVARDEKERGRGSKDRYDDVSKGKGMCEQKLQPLL